MKNLYESAKRFGRNLFVVASLAAMLSPLVGCDEYKGTSEYVCIKKSHNRIKARFNEGKRWAQIGDEQGSNRIFGSKNVWTIKYSKNMSREEALKAIDTCQRAFRKQLSIEQPSDTIQGAYGSGGK